MSLRIYSWEGKVSNEPESEELPVKIIDISLREMGGNIGKVQVCLSFSFPVSLNLCRSRTRFFILFWQNVLRPLKKGQGNFEQIKIGVI